MPSTPAKTSLGGMRQGLPSEVFAGVLGIAESTLAAADFARLQRDLL